ncbi:hypothetical protein ACM75L_33185, partial [Pseudomonas aeruginosa]
ASHNDLGVTLPAAAAGRMRSPENRPAPGEHLHVTPIMRGLVPLSSGLQQRIGNAMFEKRHTDDLVRIAAAGGGFVMDASKRHTDDLVRIAAAAAAAAKGGRVTFTGMETRHTDDLIRIAAAGRGAVVFA